MTHSKEKMYLERGIWECWHGVDFQNYDGDKQKNIIMDLVETESKQNVILYGKNGNGKTMLMNIAMKHLFDKKNEVYVIDFRHLIQEYLRSWKTDENKLARLMTVDYLAVDDLGKEFKKEDGVSADIANATLDYILRYRIQRNKPTWFTFNILLSDIQKVYNGHIASLMKRNTTAVQFDMPDYGDKLLTIVK